MQAVGADRHAMPDDYGDAGNADRKALDLAPGHRLAEKERGERSGEDRVGGNDQPAEAGGDMLQPGVAEPEIKRVVGDAQRGEHGSLAPAELPGFATQRGKAEDQQAGERKARG